MHYGCKESLICVDKLTVGKKQYHERLMNFDRIEESFNRYLESLDREKNFRPELYELGEAFFNSGLSLEDADEELRNNTSFVNGYNRGKRIAFAKELEQKRQKSQQMR